MSGTAVYINQGTQTPIANDNVGGTMFQTIKIDMGTSGVSNPFAGSISSLGQVSPDGGVSYYAAQGNTSGVQAVNATLQQSNNQMGYAMSYQEAVARGIVAGATKKVLYTSGTANGTITAWTDQGGNAYGTVTSGKTFYISQVVATAIAQGSAAGNTARVALGDNNNQPLVFSVNSSGAVPISVNGMESIASTGVLTAILTNVLAGKEIDLIVTGWEE